MIDIYSDYKYRSLTAEETKWSGYWLTSERFYHLTPCHKYGYLRIPEFNSEIQNVHTLFRKTFTLKDSPVKQAKLFITGDDIYKLYVNSAFVGEGPAQSYPFSYNYNCYDVTDLLKSGDNVIGVHLYYQGLFNIYLMSADNLCGMIAQLEIMYADGTSEKIVSDRSWKYTECDAYSAPYIYGYQTQFSEDIDLCKYPSEWINSDFSDDGWEKALVTGKPYPIDYNLVPQITPSVTHEKCYPTEIKKIDGGYFLDFGKELTGYTVFNIKGNKGDKIELRFGEELNADGSVRYEIRANCTYKDVITLSGGEDLVENFDYKGYRYVEILGNLYDIDPKEIYTLCRHYPLPDGAAEFECSDAVMNRVWDICAHGLKIGTQDTYYDCPTREKGGFVGDALISGLNHYILSSDLRIYRKFLSDCENSSRYSHIMMAHIPTYDTNFCAEYSSLVPLFIKQYYDFTGDKETVRRMLPVAEGVWDYFSEFIGESGLIGKIPHMKKVPDTMETVLIDWPRNLRDGYDTEKAFNGECTLVNIFFYGFLKTCAELYKVVGDTNRALETEKRYEALGKAIIENAYDNESGLLKDTPDSEHCALHSSALALYFGLELPKGISPVVELLKRKRLNCGVWFAYFVIEGLYIRGEYSLAYDLLTGKDEHSWYNMVKEGASACMEVWGADQKFNTGFCHPWSSSPIYFYVSDIMGIKINKPGMGSFKIEPHIDDKLDFINLTLPLANGFIKASFERKNGEMLYKISAPDDVEIIFAGDGISFERI